MIPNWSLYLFFGIASNIALAIFSGTYRTVVIRHDTLQWLPFIAMTLVHMLLFYRAHRLVLEVVGKWGERRKSGPRPGKHSGMQ